MRDFYSECKDIHPLELHDIYGINCFQSAMGYKPVIVVMPGGVFGPAVHYLKMLPGGHHSLQSSRSSNFKAYQDEIIQRLEIDDCILSDKSCSSDYREGALYFSAPSKNLEADFHLVYRNDGGNFQDKRLFCRHQSYDGLPDQIGKYKFFDKLHIPRGATPKFAQVQGAAKKTCIHQGKSLEFLIIPPQCFNSLIAHNQIHYDEQRQTAFLEKENGFIPLPYPHVPDFLTHPATPTPPLVVLGSCDI